MYRLVCGRALAVVSALAFACFSSTPALALSSQEQWEMQAGQQEYQQLARKGEIVPQSPLYAVLNPIAQRIAAIADRQYFTPFRFVLVNERSPNAFAVPGGTVYVTTSMMSFAQNEQELAGVLCHEVSHDIHHDVYNENAKDQNLQTAAGLLGMLLGGSGLGQMLVGLGANAQANTYSRSAESNADRSGAYLCAQAGENPWGAVWLFRRFASKAGSGSSMEMLSDHPRDDHRVADLISLFNSDPATFGRYRDDMSTATALQGAPPPATNVSPNGTQ
jgi:predicted Zn-dependent protease